MQNTLKKSAKNYLIFFVALLIANIAIIGCMFAVYQGVKKNIEQNNLSTSFVDETTRVETNIEFLKQTIFTFSEHQTVCEKPSKIKSGEDFFIGFTVKNHDKALLTSVTLFDSYFQDSFVYTTNSDVNKIESVEIYRDESLNCFVSSVKIRIPSADDKLRTIRIDYIDFYSADVVENCAVIGDNEWKAQPTSTNFTEIECQNKTLTIAMSSVANGVRVRVNNSTEFVQSLTGVIDLQPLNLSGGETLFCTYLDKDNQEIAYDFAAITLYKAEWDDQYSFCENGKFINYLPKKKYNAREFFFGWCIVTYNQGGYTEHFEMIDNQKLYKWRQNMRFTGLYKDREHSRLFGYSTGLVTNGITVNFCNMQVGDITEKNVFINHEFFCGDILPQFFNDNKVIESLNLANVRLISGSLTNIPNLKEIIFPLFPCELADDFVVNCPNLQNVYFDQEPLNEIPKCLYDINVYVKGKLLTKNEIMSWRSV